MLLNNTSSLNIHSKTRVKWVILELNNINLLHISRWKYKYFWQYKYMKCLSSNNKDQRWHKNSFIIILLLNKMGKKRSKIYTFFIVPHFYYILMHANKK